MSVIRTCIGCRARDEQDNLLRLVRQDGQVLDGTRPRLAGRGVYLHPSRACLELMTRRRALTRALGGSAEISDSLAAYFTALWPGWVDGAPAG